MITRQIILLGKFEVKIVMTFISLQNLQTLLISSVAIHKGDMPLIV